MVEHFDEIQVSHENENRFHIPRNSYNARQLVNTVNGHLQHCVFVIEEEDGPYRAAVRIEKKEGFESGRYLRLSSTREMLYLLGKSNISIYNDFI